MLRLQLLGGERVPVAALRPHQPGVPVELLVAADALYVLLCEESILLVFFVFRNHQNDLLQLRLYKKKRLLDFELLALGVEELHDLPEALFKVLAGPHKLSAVRFQVNLRGQLPQLRKELGLNELQLLVVAGHAVFLRESSQLPNRFPGLLHPPLDEVASIFVCVNPARKAIELRPNLLDLLEEVAAVEF